MQSSFKKSDTRVRVENGRLKQSSYVIDPRKTPWLRAWDSLTGIALVYVALITPFEVGFAEANHVGLFVINRLVDVVFCVDIVLQFFLAYPAGGSGEAARWVLDHRQIVMHYLKGWFTMDLLTTLVAGFDIASFAQPSAGEEDLTRLKGLRVLRVLRLVKLLRLLRGMALLKRWETMISLDYATLSVMNALFQVILCSHWTACIWAVQASFADDLSETWLIDKGYCVRDADFGARELNSKYVGGTAFDQPGVYSCVPASSLYSAALYFAVMTITSIGYGDITATPQNAAEQLIASVLMLIGGFLWSNVIAVIGTMLSTLNPAANEFKLTISALNKYIAQHELQPEMSQKLRDYFFRTRHLWDSAESSKVLRKLSPRMQGEVLLQVNKAWIANVHWLKDEDTAFLSEFILSMNPAVFAPGEAIAFSALFGIAAGVAVCGGLILRSGAVFGDDMLLSSPVLRNREAARSLTYLETFYIDRDRTWTIASLHRLTYQRLRRAVAFMALHRFIVLIAKSKRKLALVHAIAAERESQTQLNLQNNRWRKAVRQSSTRADFQLSMGFSLNQLSRMNGEQRVMAARERELNDLLFQIGMKGSEALYGESSPNNEQLQPAIVGSAAPALSTVSPPDNTGLSETEEWQPREAPRTQAADRSFDANTASQAKLKVTAPRQKRRNLLGASSSNLAEFVSIASRLEIQAQQATKERQEIMKALHELHAKLNLSSLVA